MLGRPVSLETTATIVPVSNLPLYLKSRLSHIANDSSSYDLQINFDGQIGQNGTFTVKAGEVVSDIDMSCTAISFVGVGGSVPFRLLGV